MNVPIDCVEDRHEANILHQARARLLAGHETLLGFVSSPCPLKDKSLTNILPGITQYDVLHHGVGCARKSLQIDSHPYDSGLL